MGKIYWFTGQPGAGKTTLGSRLYNHILDYSSEVIHIDGDKLRKLFDNMDYSKDGRYRNVDRAYDIAHFMSNKGFDVVVSIVSPFREQREKFKKNSKFVEIYVHTTNIRGRENFHVTDYEPPLNNFIDINTTDKSESDTFGELVEKLFL